MIDWVGAGPDAYRDEIIACTAKHCSAYVHRMKQYFGYIKAPEKKKKK